MGTGGFLQSENMQNRAAGITASLSARALASPFPSLRDIMTFASSPTGRIPSRAVRLRLARGRVGFCFQDALRIRSLCVVSSGVVRASEARVSSDQLAGSSRRSADDAGRRLAVGGADRRGLANGFRHLRADCSSGCRASFVGGPLTGGWTGSVMSRGRGFRRGGREGSVVFSPNIPRSLRVGDLGG